MLCWSDIDSFNVFVGRRMDVKRSSASGDTKLPAYRTAADGRVRFRLLESLLNFRHSVFRPFNSFAPFQRGHAFSLGQPARAQQHRGNLEREQSVPFALSERDASVGEGDSGAVESGVSSTSDLEDGILQTNSKSVDKDIPPMHFCEFTNEPTDICNAQWLVVRVYRGVMQKLVALYIVPSWFLLYRL